MTDAHERADLDLLMRGFQVSRMLRLVADFGIADRIPTDDPVAVETLATACGVQSQPLIRVLRALAAFGVFSVAADGSIAHTPRSRLLRTDAPNSMHHAARFWTGAGSWATWGMLDEAMTGGVPQVAAWNMSRFDYLRTHPDEARVFDAMMASFPDNRHPAIAAAYDFSNARLIADIGGGNGEALRHILSRFATPRGLLFDREDVVRAIPPGELMEGRIGVAGGNFLEGVPPGADVYMLVRVLHNWSDDDCLRILKTCRGAMHPDAILLACDQILEAVPSPGGSTGYLMDTQMLAMLGGARERSRDEMAALLSASGLTLRRVIPTASAVCIVEAVPS
jgi:hypothetical protein